MTEDLRSLTFGHLVANIARLAATREQSRGNVESEVALEAAIQALDTAIGITPAELMVLGKWLDSTEATAQGAPSGGGEASEGSPASDQNARLRALAQELERHGWLCQPPREKF